MNISLGEYLDTIHIQVYYSKCCSQFIMWIVLVPTLMGADTYREQLLCCTYREQVLQMFLLLYTLVNWPLLLLLMERNHILSPGTRGELRKATQPLKWGYL